MLLNLHTTYYILDTNIQQHKVHLMINVNVTLTDAEDHTSEGQRSLTTNEPMVISRKLLPSNTLYLVLRYNTIGNI